MAKKTATYGNKKSPRVKTQAPKKQVSKPAPVVKLSGNELSLVCLPADGSVMIFDIDGCISDDAWRFAFVQERAENDERFLHYHGALHLDDPLDEGSKILGRCIKAGHHIVFITARPEAFRNATAEWMRFNFGIVIGKNASLLMRRNSDPTPTVQIKQWLAATLVDYLDGTERIVAAYDDREDIVTMYYSVFGFNAFILDKDGVRDPLHLQQYRTRCLAPDTGAARESADKVAESTKRFVRDEHWGKTGEVPSPWSHPAAESMSKAIATLEDRALDYGRADLMAGNVATALFPNGVQFGGDSSSMRMGMMLFHVVGKLSRFASSGMTHIDSVHDLMNYSAFMDAIMRERAGRETFDDDTKSAPPVKFV